MVALLHDFLQWPVERIGQLGETHPPQRLKQRQVLGRHKDVLGVALRPHGIGGVVDIHPLVVEVDEPESGGSIGQRQRVEQVVGEVGRRVILAGHVNHLVIGFGHAPAQGTFAPP